MQRPGPTELPVIQSTPASAAMDYQAVPGPPVRVAGTFLTRRCNIACDYCGVILRRFSHELTADEWIEAFAILEHIGIERLAILGGEPTVVDGIERIVAALSKSPITFSLISNSLVPEKKLRSIVDAGLQRYSTSIDTIAGTELNHDSLLKSRTGLRVLARMREWGIQHLTAYLVLTSRNMNEVASIAEFLSAQGIWLYLIPYHHGERGHWENRSPDASLAILPAHVPELTDLVAQWNELKASGVRLANSESFLANLPRYMPGLSWHCAPSTSELRIDSDGSLTCCNDVRGDIALKWSVFDLRDEGAMPRFQADRARDAMRCVGCLWPSHYHAAEQRFGTAAVEGAFAA
jgi:MoaA/NifB/PqqE/SkfB family radical SAM enzyme